MLLNGQQKNSTWINILHYYYKSIQQLNFQSFSNSLLDKQKTNFQARTSLVDKKSFYDSFVVIQAIHGLFLLQVIPRLRGFP